ncbi:MAG: hypothetical protein ISR91_05330 [Candidatus Delongbacteria bacterium]|nr:hypothetical protein [Candidatus Delongbacteria bacterium]
MKLLIIILNKEENLDELLEGFLEMDIRGATVINSKGMGSILTSDIPIFAGLKDLLQGNRPGNKTILTLVEEDRIPVIVNLFEDVVGKLDQPGNGIIFTLPVADVIGLGRNFDSGRIDEES